jgi:glucosamine--fructose-6-phosphate aminotransferase (isomerizing)
LENTLCVVISQSGETADSLEALRTLKRKGARVLSVLNVVDSTIARESDGVAYIQAGPEISVAATKSYTSQLLTLTLLALYFAEVRGTVSPEESREIKEALLAVPGQVAELLTRENAILALAHQHYQRHSALYLARGIHLASAMEGALKLKEISYIHAEGYAGGEMKHGPIALIDAQTPTVVVAPRDSVYDKMLSQVEQVKARGGAVLAVAHADDAVLRHKADAIMPVPETHELLAPVLTVMPLQLLAYEIALLRGADVDMPRNLAKSVTVE